MENFDLNQVLSMVMMDATDKTCDHYEARSDKQLARVSIWTFMKKFVDELHDAVVSTCKDYGVDEKVDTALSRDFMKELRTAMKAYVTATEPTD